MKLTINLAVLLAVILVVLVRRRVQARSRVDQTMVLAVAVTFGVLVAPTDFGQGILRTVSDFAQSVSDAGTP
ncbi:hypothetical protein [Streptomyces spectabilis]|uniref:Cell shape-determining protein MreC n=1 Tax=Streptomyces spectabilis TaxID=68270 RepID=A0A5P2XGK0_STRST|nr:hypothetical protein [Streptomyces spectabilis]MBB5104541.1 cell shape-determining protein MreC [Streptomyces spectabilis]MCI3905104.1 hypothetical protein [Streptomyces spectabilis]QEV62120.1 hypothetical protein CP982_28245 [Streptomyces spectabilis]GGV00629.1 hypothetical protein GCM10010245_03990 [Streptomyces spectabilis]